MSNIYIPINKNQIVTPIRTDELQRALRNNKSDPIIMSTTGEDGSFVIVQVDLKNDRQLLSRAEAEDAVWSHLLMSDFKTRIAERTGREFVGFRMDPASSLQVGRAPSHQGWYYLLNRRDTERAIVDATLPNAESLFTKDIRTRIRREKGKLHDVLVHQEFRMVVKEDFTENRLQKLRREWARRRDKMLPDFAQAF